VDALIDTSEVEFRPETVAGQPAGEIVRFAENNDIEQIGIGSHGSEGVSRVLLGSVAWEVVRRNPLWTILSGVRGDLGTYVREELVDQAVTVGQTVGFSIGFGLLSTGSGRRIPLTIVDTQPDGPVVAQRTTTIEIAEQGPRPSTSNTARRPIRALRRSPTRMSVVSTTS